MLYALVGRVMDVEIETCARCGRNEFDHDYDVWHYDKFLCSQCEQQSLVATFAFHFAVPQLDKASSLRIRILTFLCDLPIRLQRRRALRKLLQGKPWTTNDMWQCRQAFEAQCYGSISRAGRVYRTCGRRLSPNDDFFDLVMNFLTWAAPTLQVAEIIIGQRWAVEVCGDFAGATLPSLALVQGQEACVITSFSGTAIVLLRDAIVLWR